MDFLDCFWSQITLLEKNEIIYHFNQNIEKFID